MSMDLISNGGHLVTLIWKVTEVTELTELMEFICCDGSYSIELDVAYVSSPG